MLQCDLTNLEHLFSLIDLHVRAAPSRIDRRPALIDLIEVTASAAEEPGARRAKGRPHGSGGSVALARRHQSTRSQ